MPRAVGVDRTSNGWVCAAVDADDGWTLSLEPSILSVWRRYGRVTEEPILVDVPIGLTAGGPRECDLDARDRLSERGGSVFLVPPRRVLDAPTLAEAKARLDDGTDPSLTTQSWHLLPQIREVDDLLRSAMDPGMALRESHPELCFRALAPEGTRLPSKHTSEGAEARLEALSRHAAGADRAYERLVAEHIDDPPSWGRRLRSDARDDVLDAMGLATSAVVAGGELERLGGDQVDAVVGRKIEIVHP